MNKMLQPQSNITMYMEVSQSRWPAQGATCTAKNASCNILRLLLLEVQGKPRPPHFCRGVELIEGMAAPFGEAGVWPVNVALAT